VLDPDPPVVSPGVVSLEAPQPPTQRATACALNPRNAEQTTERSRWSS
jgi:hypothetical protein